MLDQLTFLKQAIRDKFDLATDSEAKELTETVKSWNDSRLSELIREMESDLEIDLENNRAKYGK